MNTILEAKYKKADLNYVTTKQGQHLMDKKWKIIFSLLKRFQDMIDGILVTWNTSAVEWKLRNKNSVFLVLSSTKSAQIYILKEVEFFNLGVLKHANDSKWRSPYFTKPRVKINWVLFMIFFGI